MSSVVIAIPMLPPRACSPNARAHWATKRLAVREFRECAGWSTRDALQRAREDVWRVTASRRFVVMDVEIAWCCGRKRMDDDNAWASLKAARDGIADALFAGEDRFMTQGTLIQTRGDGTVTVTLRTTEGT